MSYLFTSTPSNSRQGTSQLFADYGNPGQIPGPIGQSGIYVIRKTLAWHFTILRNKIALALASTMSKKIIGISDMANIATLPSIARDLLSPPEIVTSFDGKELQEQVVTTMSSIGFKRNPLPANSIIKDQPHR